MNIIVGTCATEIARAHIEGFIVGVAFALLFTFASNWFIGRKK